MKDQSFCPIPIIDAGVKVESGYDVYEEGGKRYTCQLRTEAISWQPWPGDTHFPDFRTKMPESGSRQIQPINLGIEGFWNDMNEPAIFYSSEGWKRQKKLAGEFSKDKEGRIPVLENAR